MRVFTVVGARPEFVQLTPVTAAIRAAHDEILVHTGQHFDDNMSQVFFDELGLPQPTFNLGVGGGTHASQTGRMLIELEQKMLETSPDWVVVFGDTNSTLAGALAAAKLHIPVAHIEAGLRSFDRAMPEEVNRVVTDHLSQLLLAPTEVAVGNLAREGIVARAELVGDVRVDVMESLRDLGRPRAPALLERIGLGPQQQFALATLHRASNTDERSRLGAILAALGALPLPIVLPVHPRLAKMIDHFGVCIPGSVRAIEPVGILEMMALLDAAALVITDSGGLQKEAYLLERPTVTLRDTTEWIETVHAGWNRLCEPKGLEAAAAAALGTLPSTHPPLYGLAGVGRRIVEQLERHLREPSSPSA